MITDEDLITALVIATCAFALYLAEPNIVGVWLP